MLLIIISIQFSELLLPCMSEQNNTISIQFVDSYSRAIQRASNGESSLHRLYKDEYSNDFAYAVIGLIKITTCNEKALTACDTACKFLHGPKKILPGPGQGWPGCGYATDCTTVFISRMYSCFTLHLM